LSRRDWSELDETWQMDGGPYPEKFSVKFFQ